VNSIKEEVKQLFIEYLEKNQQRKTPERFHILDEIYSNKEHFDVETLFVHMKNRNYRVSRATVYNTLDLLQDL
jgi:Fur family ferric uptake transcriptional regulator